MNGLKHIGTGRQSRLDASTVKQNQVLVCAKCWLEHGDSFRSRDVGWKKKRVLLDHVVGNIFNCPKCGAVYYDRDFDRFGSRPKKGCKNCGSNRLKYDSKNGELVCTRCGLVS